MREWGERVSEREMVKVGLERCDRVRVERVKREREWGKRVG